jgi:hypothetical protein
MIELQYDIWNLIYDKATDNPQRGGSGFEMVRT